MAFVSKVVEDFIGKGLGYPITLTNGKPDIITGVPLIASSMKVIASWPIGQRFMLGEFGSRITRLLEEPNNNKLTITLTSFFKEVILLWEPRVEALEVTVAHIDMKKVVVEATYRVVTSAQPEIMTFPFYRRIAA